MIQIKVNSFANKTNWKLSVLYPEHKNKNRDLLVFDDMNKNVILIDETKKFKNIIKEWSQQQEYKNEYRWKDIKRKISKEELKFKLEKKRIISNYTLSESSIFFQEQFNNDEEAIIDFYNIFLKTWLEEAKIPEENVVSAIIHFDQSTPHLHVSLSHFYLKYNKEFDVELWSVNSKKFNALHNLNKVRVDNYKFRRTQKENFLSDNFNKILSPEKYKMLQQQEIQNHGLYDSIARRLNDENGFKNINKNLISEVRGFKAENINYDENKIEGKVWTWNLIYKYRLGVIDNKYRKIIKNSKNLSIEKLNEIQIQHAKEKQELKSKFEYTLKNKELFFQNKNYDFKPTKYEIQSVINKRRYFERMNLDLMMLGIFEEVKNKNSIERNRIYNQILSLTQLIKIDHNLDRYTPQDLANDIWNGNFREIQNRSTPDDVMKIQDSIYKNKELKIIRNNILNSSIQIKNAIQEFNSWYSVSDIKNNENFLQEKLGIQMQQVNKILLTQKINDLESERINIKVPLDKQLDIDDLVKIQAIDSLLDFKENKSININSNGAIYMTPTIDNTNKNKKNLLDSDDFISNSKFMNSLLYADEAQNMANKVLNILEVQSRTPEEAKRMAKEINLDYELIKTMEKSLRFNEEKTKTKIKRVFIEE